MNPRPLDDRTPEEIEQMPVPERVRRLEANDRTIIRLQRSQLRAVIALIVLLVIIAALIGKGISHNSHHASTIAGKAHAAAGKAALAERSLRSYEIASCHRGNERTIADNFSSRATWRFFTTTARLLRVALAHPQPGQPPPNARERRTTERFIAGLESDAQSTVWHHLVEDCAYAVDHPQTFKLPPGHRFNDQGVPRGALELRPGE